MLARDGILPYRSRLESRRARSIGWAVTRAWSRTFVRDLVAIELKETARQPLGPGAVARREKPDKTWGITGVECRSRSSSGSASTGSSPEKT